MMQRVIRTTLFCLLFTGTISPAFAECDAIGVDLEPSLKQTLDQTMAHSQSLVATTIDSEIQHSLWVNSLAMYQYVPDASRQLIALSESKPASDDQ